MKTTIDIPNDLLKDAISLSKSRTKREVVISALSEFTRRHRMSKLVESFGKCDKMMSTDELEQARKEG